MTDEYRPRHAMPRRTVPPARLVAFGIGALIGIIVVVAILDRRNDVEPETASLTTGESSVAPEPAGTETIDQAVTSATPAETSTETPAPTSVASRPPIPPDPSDPPVEPTTLAATAPNATAPDNSTETTPASSASPTTAPAEPPPTTTAEVPESRAVVQGGKIYLEGAVPTEAVRAEIVALASEILGPDNVVDGYFVDVRASDPNLGQIRVADAVLFETDSAVIASEFEQLLNQGLALLTIRPAATFTVFGHTDSRGTDAYNDLLSRERAVAVVDWYARRGIDPSRLTADGRGSREPIATNETPDGRQQNRRIEVLIENLLSGGD